MSQEFCVKCGRPLPEGDAFCGKCGQPRRSPTQPVSVFSPPPISKPKRTGLVWKILISIILGFILLNYLRQLIEIPERKRLVSSETIKVGERGKLCESSPEGKPTSALVADSVESLNEFFEATNKDNVNAVADLEQARAIWNEDCGTKVLVLADNVQLSTRDPKAVEPGIAYEEVRILSGPHEGQAAWTMSRTLKKE